MTTTDLEPAFATKRAPAGYVHHTSRLLWLHAVSRRLPTAVGLQAAFAVLLAAGLHFHWTIAGGPAASMLLQLTVVTGAAAVTAVSTHGPFGDAERATGRWLPWLRLTATVALTASAFAALAAGASAGTLPGGSLALLRDLVGATGLGLLSAAALGGAFGWVGPMAYLLITEVALTANPTTPWIWAARPTDDRGAAICVGLVVAAGAAVITALGDRGRGNRGRGD